MRECEVKMVKSYEVSKITCNKCGKEFNISEPDLIEQVNCYPIHIAGMFKNNIEFDLCEDCLDEITHNFKFNPIKLEEEKRDAWMIDYSNALTTSGYRMESEN